MRVLTMTATLVAAAIVATPAVAADDSVFLKMGAAAIFRIVDGLPTDVRTATPDDAVAQGEIKASLSYRNGASMLTVVNNSDTFFNYRAFITDRADREGRATSVCTLMSNGRTAFENWPGQPLPGIRLSGFAPAAKDEMVCR